MTVWVFDLLLKIEHRVWNTVFFNSKTVEFSKVLMELYFSPSGDGLSLKFSKWFVACCRSYGPWNRFFFILICTTLWNQLQQKLNKSWHNFFEDFLHKLLIYNFSSVKKTWLSLLKIELRTIFKIAAILQLFLLVAQIPS